MGSYLGYALTAPIFLTGSGTAFLLLAALPPSVASQVTLKSWFIASLPVGLISTAAAYFFLAICFQDKEQIAEKNVRGRPLGKRSNPWSREEKIAGTFMVVAFVMWLSTSLHGLDMTTVSILTVLGLIICRVTNLAELVKLMDWRLLLFQGVVMNFGVLMSLTRWDVWVAQVLNPVFKSLVVNPFLFILFLVVGVYLLRLIFLSYNALLVTLMAILGPMLLGTGINPWLVGLIIYWASQSCWFFHCQAPSFILAYRSFGTLMATVWQTRVFSAIYMLIMLISILLCLPYWRYLRLIY